jgi:hypothetical protein
VGAPPFVFKGAVSLGSVPLVQGASAFFGWQPAVILSEPASEGSLCFRGSGDRRIARAEKPFPALKRGAVIQSSKAQHCHPASELQRCHHEEVHPHVFMRENDEGSAFCL